jgi:hypothetical protein
MTSQGDGRNLIYFQTYDFEFFCKIQQKAQQKAGSGLVF